MRSSWLIASVAIAILMLATPSVPVAAQLPAGTTKAVLSYVDAADGYVSVVRHWHGAGGQDVQVFPYTPYFWDGCLPFQNGALMFLLVSPVGYPPPGLSSSGAYTSQYLAKLGQTAGAALAQAQAALPAEQAQAKQNLQQIIGGLVTPGDPAYEALKAALGTVNSLPTYEDYGYATFMFLRWKWVYVPFPVPVPCAQIDIRSVPEGYGMPFVARAGGGGGGGPSSATGVAARAAH